MGANYWKTGDNELIFTQNTLKGPSNGTVKESNIGDKHYNIGSDHQYLHPECVMWGKVVSKENTSVQSVSY